MRLTRRRLKEQHAEEYERIRVQVELDLYPQVVERFMAEHPRAARTEEEG